MPPRRMSQLLHPDEAPPQELINLPPPNQSSTQILPTIVEDPEHLTFGNIPEIPKEQPHQPTHTSTAVAGLSHTHDAVTSSQTSAGAPRQSPPQAHSLVHILLGDADPDQVQIDDWDEEAEEEAAAAEEKELARVQQEIERLRQEQESILRRQAAFQHAEAHRQNINRK
jgi:hypothetical protein